METLYCLKNVKHILNIKWEWKWKIKFYWIFIPSIYRSAFIIGPIPYQSLNKLLTKLGSHCCFVCPTLFWTIAFSLLLCQVGWCAEVIKALKSSFCENFDKEND